jgi:hypothetical protein
VDEDPKVSGPQANLRTGDSDHTGRSSLHHLQVGTDSKAEFIEPNHVLRIAVDPRDFARLSWQ